jgi:hypothetical protein
MQCTCVRARDLVSYIVHAGTAFHYLAVDVFGACSDSQAALQALQRSNFGSDIW